MVNELGLTMVITAAGIVIAAVISLRALKAQHKGGAAGGSATNSALVPAAMRGSSAASIDGAPATETPLASTTNPASAAPRPSAPSPTLAPHPKSATAIVDEPPRPIAAVDVFAMLSELALGKTGRGAKTFTRHDHIAATVGESLHDAATQQRYAPRRPNMLPRLLSAANDDNYSRRELAALIARDPSLVGSLLKIANSSYYRISPDPIESVDRAVILLGTNGIRSLVTAALMQPIFRVGATEFPKFPEIAWEHTFRSANAAVPYNFLVEKSDPYAAELLSLVMGLAGIVIFRITMDQYGTDLRLRPDAGVMTSLIDTHSASVARQIGASWELSEQTLTGLDGQNIAISTYPTPLGRSLYFGRLVGALAVLRLNGLIDDETGKLSVPATNIDAAQIDRMWTRLIPKTGKD